MCGQKVFLLEWAEGKEWTKGQFFEGKMKANTTDKQMGRRL